MPTTLERTAAAPTTAAVASALPVWARVIAALVSIWLLLPLLTATYVEAFAARLQTMALLSLRGQLGQDDAAYPVDLEYFYTTRGGTVHALAWMMRLTHSTGALNFRLLIWMSFALFAGASILFARRWSGCSAWLAVAVLVIAPGLCESGFFFADNLPSAAVAALALAVVASGRELAGPVRYLLAGITMACAVMLRIDAVVAAPSVALGVLLYPGTSLRAMLGRWCAYAAGMAATFFVAWYTVHISLLQGFAVGRMHTAIHLGWGDRPSIARLLTMFFGPTIFPIVYGAVRVWRSSRALGERAALVIWPACFYAVFLFRAVELRDYLLLGAPFLLLLGSLGLESLLQWITGPAGRWRTCMRVAVALFAVSLVLPPFVLMQDGPRTIFGRLYAPVLWWQWQHSTDTAVETLGAVGENARPGEPVLVISTLFQADRYLHLALLERGYALDPVRAGASCGGVETYRKGELTVLHIRTENPYYLLSDPPLRLPDDYVRAYQVASGLRCLAGTHFAHTYLSTWGRMWQGYLRDTPEFTRGRLPMEIPIPAHGLPSIGRTKFLQVERLVPLEPADLAAIDQRAHALMHDSEMANHGDWRPPRNYAEFHREAEPRVWTSHP